VSQTKGRPSAYDADLISHLKELAGGDASGVLTVNEFSRWLDYAEKSRTSWQRWYYGGRSTVTVVAAAVTALTGASAGLSGGAGLSVKITAAVLSFIVAATNGVLEVWQVTNRWRLYRVLRSRLWQAGWHLATADAPGKFQGLTKEVSAAIGDFEYQYLMQVLLSQPGGRDDKRPHASGTDENNQENG
jgi:hypothetical protein